MSAKPKCKVPHGCRSETQHSTYVGCVQHLKQELSHYRGKAGRAERGKREAERKLKRLAEGAPVPDPPPVEAPDEEARLIFNGMQEKVAVLWAERESRL